jgi:GNAT superfamily N-acetyltransferase
LSNTNSTDDDQFSIQGYSRNSFMPTSNVSAKIQIRDAQPEDRDFVLALLPELHSNGSPPWRSAHQMRATDERVVGDALQGRSPGAVVLIALAGPQRVGFIHLCEEEDYYSGVCGHIGDLVVVPQARGQGVGTALIEAAEQWARTRGYRMLTLNVFVGNKQAQLLYETLGFHAETVRHTKNLKT